MENKEIIQELKNIKNRMQSYVERVSRKTSWRASEKAMAVAAYRREIQAIDLAISKLNLVD